MRDEIEGSEIESNLSNTQLFVIALVSGIAFMAIAGIVLPKVIK